MFIYIIVLVLCILPTLALTKILAYELGNSYEPAYLGAAAYTSAIPFWGLAITAYLKDVDSYWVTGLGVAPIIIYISLLSLGVLLER